MRRRALLKGGKKDYFAMVVTADGSIYWSGRTTDNTLSYSKDNGATWTTIINASISVTAGDKILWKGTLTPQSSNGSGYFSGYPYDAKYSIEGNIMSLLYGDDFEDKTSLSDKPHAFCKLFYQDKSVTSAENLLLPATTLANGCYDSMFKLCTSLTTPPVLPATTLANGCYISMFSGCSSLTTAPELPATTLADGCYISMFSDCSSLTTAPELPATTLASSCYAYMFSSCFRLTSIKCLATNISANSYTRGWTANVASSGTFTKASSMSGWTTGSDGIPEGWTVQNA